MITATIFVGIIEMKISITLPSIHPEAFLRTWNNIRDTTKNEHEILVVSPFCPIVLEKLSKSDVTWVRENEPLGSAGATAVAGKQATGDFIVAMSDDQILVDGWDEKVIENFLDRELKHYRNRPGPFCLGLRHEDRVGTVFGMYYPYFPMVRKEDVDRIGWFDSCYHSGWGDVDLGMRYWNLWGRCEWSEKVILTTHPDDDRKMQDGKLDVNHHRQSDMDIFVKRWNKQFGFGWNVSHMRGFNVDVDIRLHPQIIDKYGYSINCRNDLILKCA